MEKLRRTSNTQAFEEIFACLKKATKEVKATNREIEESRQELRDTIDNLLAEIEAMPEE